jgi:hypothetical protein
VHAEKVPWRNLIFVEGPLRVGLSGLSAALCLSEVDWSAKAEVKRPNSSLCYFTTSEGRYCGKRNYRLR